MNVRADQEPTAACNRALLRPIEGSQAVFEELFSRNRAQLYNTAFRLLANREDAEDAVQEGLLAAYRNRNTFEGRSQLSSWLTRIVINAALMQRRRSRVRSMVSINQSVQQDTRPLVEDLCDPGPNPEEILLRQEQFQRLELALRAAPEVNRRAWWLCRVHGLKIREVAEIMGISSGTLKSQLFRVRRKIRKEAAETRHSRGALDSRWLWRR